MPFSSVPTRRFLAVVSVVIVYQLNPWLAAMEERLWMYRDVHS